MMCVLHIVMLAIYIGHLMDKLSQTFHHLASNFYCSIGACKSGIFYKSILGTLRLALSATVIKEAVQLDGLLMNNVVCVCVS